MITLRMLLVIVSATASGSFLMPCGSLSIAPAPSLTMRSIRPVSSKSETVSEALGLDVGVEQEAHARFVLLEVDVFASPELHLGSDIDVVGDLLLDGLGFGVAVSGWPISLAMLAKARVTAATAL